jgi:hypothetical protein
MWVHVDVDPKDTAAMARLIDDGTIGQEQAVHMILADMLPGVDAWLGDIARHIVNVLQY